MKLELFYPYRPFRINQRFGDNQACSNPDTTGVVSARPDGTCPVGKVKLYPLLGLNGHTGLDLYAPDGVVLRSPINGIVKELSLEAERGMGVGIVSDTEVDMGKNGISLVKVRQWHGKKLLVDFNQKVVIGQPVMIADNTGLSAGSHNHFEIKPVYYTNTGALKNVFQNNGYAGSVDPEPYFNGRYAEDITAIPKASLQITEFAEKLKANGNTVAATQVLAIAAFLRAFGY